MLERAKIRLIKTASTWRVLVKTNVMKKVVKFQGDLYLVKPKYMADRMFVFIKQHLHSLGKIIPPEEPNIEIVEYDAVFTQVGEVLNVFNSEKFIGQIHLIVHPDCCGEKIIDHEKNLLWLNKPEDFRKYMRMFLNRTSITLLPYYMQGNYVEYFEKLGFKEKMSGYWTINLGEDE